VSFKNANGPSAFLICSNDVTYWIIGVNAVLGAPDEQSAYRSELARASGILMAIAILWKKNILSGNIEIALDG
jgi:hypothetical protein